jgi:S1-C subfamily serine protease
MAIQRGLIAGIVVRVAPVLLLTTLVTSTAAGQTLSGSGVVIGAKGEILTNAHVVENCAQITVRSSSGDLAEAFVLARSWKNDLTVIRSKLATSSVATCRDEPWDEPQVRAGDAVVALG